MMRLFASVVACALAASAAQAHFVWIVPDGADGTRAKVVFSDSLEPDEAVPIENIARTKLLVRDAAGKEAPLAWSKGEHAYLVKVPAPAPLTVGGVCPYGVVQRGQGKPFLLAYYPKLILGKAEGTRPWDKLPLEIVPRGAGRFQVLFAGKPAADAEVVVLTPAAGNKETLTTDARGEVALKSAAPGLYGLRARHVEAKAGEQDGKKYEEVRHYATLVLCVAEQASAGSEGAAPARDKSAADPAAGKLLAEARAARAQWEHFPGFAADVEVNLDGRVSRGKVRVGADGKVSFEALDKATEAWAGRVLGSIAAHRTDGSAERDTPCAFADQDADHPLGRAVKVLSGETHSSYRIKDKQILVVNRRMKDQRFTITVLENRANAEGKYLPASYAVSYWDVKTGALLRTEAHHQTWARVGRFDLPRMARVVTASKEATAEDGAPGTGRPTPAAAPSGLSAKSLILSDHKLLEKAAR